MKPKTSHSARSLTAKELHNEASLPHESLPSYPQKYFSVCVCALCITEHLLKLSMEDLVEFLQVTLSKNFFYEDDFVIEQLQTSMTELRRVKLELPAPGTDTVSHAHTRTHTNSHAYYHPTVHCHTQQGQERTHTSNVCHLLGQVNTHHSESLPLAVVKL